jgi:uncharacterized protein YfaS (alpha-2-macroglobulin family)
MGNNLTVSVAFNTNGVAVDPTTVVCKVVAPDGTQSTPQVARDGVGAYHATIAIPAAAASAGEWTYRFEGTGANVAAVSSQFFVPPSPFYPT